MTVKNRAKVPFCPDCRTLAWQDMVIVKGIEWTKCRVCGRMQKVSKKDVEPK